MYTSKKNSQNQKIEYKVGIRHFLNKKIKPDTTNTSYDETICYWVYIQITVKRQTTVIKSMIGSLPESLFDKILSSNIELLDFYESRLKRELEREKANIEYVIKTLASDKDDNFKLSNFIHVYEKATYKLSDALNKLLLNEIQLFCDNYYKRKENIVFRNPSISFKKNDTKTLFNPFNDLIPWHNKDLSAYKVIQGICGIFPPALQLIKEYRSYIWDFLSLYDNAVFSASDLILTNALLDWEKGTFQKQMLISLPIPEEDLQLLFNDIEKLLTKYSFDKVENYKSDEIYLYEEDIWKLYKKHPKRLTSTPEYQEVMRLFNIRNSKSDQGEEK
ncbi:hypothetical protein ACFPMF_20565 [Larkinella bovis]|uniref:Uncharacterized protein n=1 Tax=Larkinella bovis TaxID=683041 RepID=A0ABW0IG44_9BACT